MKIASVPNINEERSVISRLQKIVYDGKGPRSRIRNDPPDGYGITHLGIV